MGKRILPSEKTGASLSDFEEAFGAPCELLSKYMSTLDQEEVRNTSTQKGAVGRWAPNVIWAIIIVMGGSSLQKVHETCFGHSLRV